MSFVCRQTVEEQAVAQVFLGEITGDDGVESAEEIEDVASVAAVSETTSSTSTSLYSTTFPPAKAAVWKHLRKSTPNMVPNSHDTGSLSMSPGIFPPSEPQHYLQHIKEYYNCL